MSKTVKVSDEEYALIQKARNVLAKKGTERLPPELRPSDPSKSFTLGRMVGLCAEALIHILGNEKEVSTR